MSKQDSHATVYHDSVARERAARVSQKCFKSIKQECRRRTLNKSVKQVSR